MSVTPKDPVFPGNSHKHIEQLHGCALNEPEGNSQVFLEPVVKATTKAELSTSLNETQIQQMLL